MDLQEIKRLLGVFPAWIEKWYEDPSREPRDKNTFAQLALELHRYNFLLWQQEDIARRTDVDDGVIADVKHKIDHLNQERNNLIEKLDEWMLTNHYNRLIHEELPMRTENPGSALDRSSILALKIYHMFQQTKRDDVDRQHLDMCRQKLEILEQQRHDLQNALLAMLGELNEGKIRMKIYRQFKMYNDPSLNPQLYGRKPSQRSKT